MPTKKTLHNFDLTEVSLVHNPSHAAARPTYLIDANGRSHTYVPYATNVVRKSADAEQRKRGKQVIKSFVIKEISMVDRPSMVGARMVLLKRDDSQDAATESTPAPVAFDKHDRLDKETTMSSFDTLDDAAHAIAKRDNISAGAAFSKAAQEFPSLLKAYREMPPPAPMAKRAPSPAIKEFENLAKSISREEGIPMTKALGIAADEDPALFARYQNA